jgi:hypothetical protein
MDPSTWLWTPPPAVLSTWLWDEAQYFMVVIYARCPCPSCIYVRCPGPYVQYTRSSIDPYFKARARADFFRRCRDGCAGLMFL